MPDRSPQGSLKGKSRASSIPAKNIHHIVIEVTNNEAPPACKKY
jgi:hypothetical protein